METHESKRRAPAPPGERGPVVLAAIGDDEADQMVAALALQAARFWPDASLHLAHVIDVLAVVQAAAAAPSPEWSHPDIDDIRRRGRVYVDGFARSTSEALGRPVEGHLLFGPPVDKILELTNELRASMLIVGGRDVGRLARLLGGSTAAALVHKTPCSVLLARTPKYQADVPCDAGQVCPDCLQAEAASCGTTLRCPRHALAYGSTHGAVGSAEREAP